MNVFIRVGSRHQRNFKTVQQHSRFWSSTSHWPTWDWLENNTLWHVYDVKFYIQHEGAAMGCPVSPIIANLFMENFDEKAISSFHSPPRYWGRYVDDKMVIIDRSQVDKFTQHLNSVHSSIKFAIERENNNSIAILDTLTTRNPNGSLSAHLFQCVQKKKCTHGPISQLLQSPALGTQIRCYSNSHSPRQSLVR